MSRVDDGNDMEKMCVLDGEVSQPKELCKSRVLSSGPMQVFLVAGNLLLDCGRPLSFHQAVIALRKFAS